MSKQEEELDDSKDDKKKKKDKSVIQTKVIIRRLPIGMNKSQFLEIFEPLPEHDVFRYVSGDRSLAPYNYPRAYINFLNIDDILLFRDKYDGIEFESQSGQKSTCVIEYAPFQKIAKKGRKKEDPKVNTIEKDADYIKFLESLKEEEEKETIDVEKFLEELDLRDKQNQQPIETPLTAFVKQRREERKRIREERRKQDIERRKKKDEERRKKREAERRRKLEIEKSKRKEKTDGEVDNKKKTLGETKREMLENNRLRQNMETNEENGNKIKLLQKKANDETFKSKNDETESKSTSRLRETRPSRDFTRKWKDDHNRPSSGKYKDGNKDFDSKDEKSKFKKPDREIYYPSSVRGGRGGFRGGRGVRPQKYSEQRSRKPNENDK